jgi:predicted transcriptional regulator
LSKLSLLRSDLKLKIIFSLLENEKGLSELKKETQTRETTISHSLKELENMELTTKISGIYKLTPLGILEAQIYKGCYLSVETLKKHKDFWATHDTSCIPLNCIWTIGDIENSNLIKSTNVDLQKVHDNSINLIGTSKTIFTASPIFHHDYIPVFTEILASGGKVKLIITQEVLEKLASIEDVLNKYMFEGNLELYVNNNLKLALTVTEKFWSLGLFSSSGEFDYTNDLVGSSIEGIEWGRQLFEKIRINSVNITK